MWRASDGEGNELFCPPTPRYELVCLCLVNEKLNASAMEMHPEG